MRLDKPGRILRGGAWNLLFSFLFAVAPSAAALVAQAPSDTGSKESTVYSGLEYRSIGPFRGGRSAAVAGVPGDPHTFYFGGTGGGLWKTTDGGSTWRNVSDGFFGGSIGAVAVSEWDNNVVYVGGGEVTVRGNVSHGYGVWKSMDAGETWTHMGLEQTRHIPRIRVHPRNPDLVYAAALGHLYGPNPERGVYRSKNGGKNWERVLFVDENAGAVDLILDPNNPRILYASTWRILRTPYSLESGGEGSGLWKSTDGGDTWKEISRNEGLPKGTLGIIGIAVSPVNSNRLWAIVEAEQGGVFRSDDAGKTWNKVNDDRSLRQRAWYYSRIYAGTRNLDEVHVINVGFHRSKDGGRTYQRIRTPHGDHHDLWIAPEDGNRMIVADDGGAQISYDAGENWSTLDNQPTAQFYRVITDNHFPYRIYGAQQDNSTVRIVHRSDGGSIGEDDWESTAGGESGHIAPDPDDDDIVYGGSYGGLLQRVNHRTGESRNINAWPDNPMGHGAEDYKYRFQWNFPIFFSPHDSNVLYTAANVLFKTTDEGQSWEIVSPDLTTNDKSKQASSGGPITQDNTSVEYYCTIFAALESPLEPGVIWTGSDDGLVHVTRDGGKNWKNVTPPDLPPWTQINSIEAHPTQKGGLYLAGTRYKLDDFQPYLYKTLDYGATWTRIDRGIDRGHFTRVVRADPGRAGLLYAGTENGMYISFDDGADWSPFQLNLPIVPVTDLTIKDNDLIVATQGRAFWMLDDLTLLHQLQPDQADKSLHVFHSRPSYPIGGGGFGGGGGARAGQNPPGGVALRYYLKDELAKDAALKIEILEADGDLIRGFSTKAKERSERFTAEKGLNQFVWNMRYPDAESFPGLVMWAGSVRGPRAVPGTYKARFTLGETVQETDFEIEADPRSSATQADLEAQFDFLIEVRDKLSETHKAILRIRDVRAQVDNLTKRLAGDDSAKNLIEQGKALNKMMTEVEEALYQTKNRSGQDPLNFPIRLNNKLAAVGGVAAGGSFRPTDQSVAVKKELTAAIDAELHKLDEILDKDLKAFNQAVRKQQVPAVILKKDN